MKLNFSSKQITIFVSLLVSVAATPLFADNANTSGGALQTLVPTLPSSSTAPSTVSNALPANASLNTPTNTNSNPGLGAANTAASASSGQTTANALSGLAAAVGSTPSAGAASSTDNSAQAQKRLTQISQQQQQALNANQGVSDTSGQSASLTPADQIAEDAFQSAVKTALPMSPDQIQRLRKLFSDTQYATSALPSAPPRPVARSQFVNLAPGATPPPIRLSQGIVTTLLFVDSTGGPWPIDAYDIGDPSTFNIQWNKTDNMLMIQPTKLYGFGNIAVKLKGLNTPVMLTLTPPQLSDRNVVDYRVDLHVPGSGPNANPLPNDQGFSSVETPDLLGVLSGVPPSGAKTLSIPDADSQAWALGDKLYVRTRLTILSPGWLSTLSSPDGMKAYLLQMTPTLVVAKHGKETMLKIEGF